MVVATTGCTVNPSNTACETTLPGKILIMTLFTFFSTICFKKSSFSVGSNNNVNFCRNFMKTVLKQSYLTNTTYLQDWVGLVVVGRLLLYGSKVT